MSTISAGTTSTTTLQVSGDTTGSLVIKTNDTGSGGTTALTVDTSQNVGIGTSSPVQKLQVASNGGGIVASASAGSQAQIYVAANGATAGSNSLDLIQDSSNVGYLYQRANQPLLFGTNATERMRIDTSGNLLVGTTNATAKIAVEQTSASNALNAYINYASSTNIAGIRVTKYDNNTTTSQRFVEFVVNAGATGCGQINANGANTAAFGTYSDERLKENITDLPSQLANIMALRPVEFDYIESEGGGHQIGFIAQEVQKIYPDLIGEREDGMLTLTDMNKNDARLIKAIQELKQIVDAQAAEIAALKTKVGG